MGPGTASPPVSAKLRQDAQRGDQHGHAHRHERDRDQRQQDGDERRSARRGLAEPWCDERKKRGRNGRVDPERIRVADRTGADRPDEGRQVPGEEQRDPGDEEGEPCRGRRGLRSRHGGGLIGDDLRRRDPGQPAEPEERGQPQAVEAVTSAEGYRGRHPRQCRTATAENADQRELGRAGEHQQRGGAALQDGQPRGGSGRAERDPADPDGQSDRQRIPGYRRPLGRRTMAVRRPAPAGLAILRFAQLL